MATGFGSPSGRHCQCAVVVAHWLIDESASSHCFTGETVFAHMRCAHGNDQINKIFGVNTSVVCHCGLCLNFVKVST